MSQVLLSQFTRARTTSTSNPSVNGLLFVRALAQTLMGVVFLMKAYVTWCVFSSVAEYHHSKPHARRTLHE